jgi:hypothetical protein
MKEEPPKPPQLETNQEKINELLSQENIPDEIFEEQLTKIVNAKQTTRS